MNDLLVYLLKSNAILIAFYGFYILFLSKLTFFKANRVYLLGSIILSAILPLFEFNIFRSNNLFLDTITIQPFIEETINIQNNNEYVTQQNISTTNITKYIYISIVLILLSKAFFNLFAIRRLRGKKHSPQAGGYTIYWHEQNYAFSFFKSIFLPRHLKGAHEFEQILKHEKAHARQLHSIDLVLMEIAAAFFWFNPFVYFLKKSVKQLHEFLADQEVINSGTTSLEYITGLRQEFFRNYSADLVANFKTKSIKRRLIMITKHNSKKISLLKYLVIIPIVAGLLIFLNTKDLSSSNITSRDGINLSLDRGPSIFPVDKSKAEITVGFGMSKHPITGKMRMHNGIDIKAPEGTDIYATADGIVKIAEFKKGWGNIIVVSHGKVYKTYYSHLKDFAVKVGDKVTRGQVIGYVGNTGMSTGPHLHYEVSKNGKKIDPKDFFN